MATVSEWTAIHEAVVRTEERVAAMAADVTELRTSIVGPNGLERRVTVLETRGQWPAWKLAGAIFTAISLLAGTVYAAASVAQSAASAVGH